MRLASFRFAVGLAIWCIPLLPGVGSTAVPLRSNVSLSADTTRFVVDGEANEARYRVREQLAGVSLPNDAVGVTKAVEGGIAVDQAGRLVSSGSKITVELASMASDRSMRDGYVRRNILATGTYPAVVLAPTELRGLAWPLPTTGTVTFELVGNLTVRDVTRSTTWDVTLTIAGNTLTGTATTSFTFEQFGLTKPRVAMVMGVEDTIKLEYDLRLVRQQGPRWYW